MIDYKEVQVHSEHKQGNLDSPGGAVSLQSSLMWQVPELTRLDIWKIFINL